MKRAWGLALIAVAVVVLIGGRSHRPADAEVLCAEQGTGFVVCPTTTVRTRTVPTTTLPTTTVPTTTVPTTTMPSTTNPSPGAVPSADGLSAGNGRLFGSNVGGADGATATGGSTSTPDNKWPVAAATGVLGAVAAGLLVLGRRRRPAGRYAAKRTGLLRRRQRPDWRLSPVDLVPAAPASAADPVAVATPGPPSAEPPVAELVELPVAEPADPPVVESLVAEPAEAPVAEQATLAVPNMAGPGLFFLARSSTGTGLYGVSVSSLADVTATLEVLEAVDADYLLVVPEGAALLVAEPEELIEAALLVDGICVAASPIPLASPVMAGRAEEAVAATGTSTASCHPHPHALLGQVTHMRNFLADLPEGDNDADRVTALVLSGSDNLILDVASLVFHVLDGTGTDVIIADGCAYAGGGRPLVLIDPTGSGEDLDRVARGFQDAGTRDLSRLLTYSGAVTEDSLTVEAARDVLVMPLWKADFCELLVRAAEVAGRWSSDGPFFDGEVGTWLDDLNPRLFSLLKADLDRRVVPVLAEHWPGLAPASVQAVSVIRQSAGRSNGESPATYGNAAFVGSVRLNAGYEGGELVLSEQGWEDSTSPQGSLAVWPSDGAHGQWPSLVTRGVKYRLAVWWYLPSLDQVSELRD